MRSIKSFAVLAVLVSLSSLAHAVKVSGTVTDKTTGKPAAGDKVELVDVQAGMSVADSATTDGSGRYSLNKPGNGPYLVRVTHQGSPYFIAAPENGPGDIPVFDAAPHVNGISIEALVYECEAQNGQVQVLERYLVHNTSSPPTTEYNPSHGFEVVLPPDAVVEGSQAKRPLGMFTSTALKPAAAKNHYTFDFPIQPDEAEKDTEFQITYHLPYASGSYTFKPELLIRADNVAFLLPKGIAYKGPGFQSVPQDPNLQTLLARNVQPGQELTLTISGNGSLPREDQGQPTGGGAAAAAAAGGQETAPSGPGGGIGNPINTPDPLSKYKWWIVLFMFLGLSAVAGFLLRRPAGAAVPADLSAVPAPPPAPSRPRRATAPDSAAAASPAPAHVAPAYTAPPDSHGSHNATLLAVLKEEMFAVESEKFSGTITPTEYREQKNALETVLKRALRKQAN
ncbi:MAG TPA: carboxypeptidase-like regulatory domain-containing protein [Terracidiphilus sp.]